MALPKAASKDENPSGAGCARYRLVRENPSLRLTPGPSRHLELLSSCTRHSVVDRLAPPIPPRVVPMVRRPLVDVLIERCAGIDIGKDEVVACVRTPAPSGRGRCKRTRTFASFTASLEAMADWFTAEGVTEIAMEATGSYWKPVWYVLEDRAFALKLVNAHHVKILPGRKSDVLDAEWLAELLEHGLLRGSFVPPPAIRELRDLTRYRKRLIQAHTSECQRIQKTLEDAGIKLDSVASDVLGVSGRAMLAALVAGERDPDVLADRAWRGAYGTLVRYADDALVMCRSQGQAVAALARLTALLAELGLQPKPAKTRIVQLAVDGGGVDFLGFHHRLVQSRARRGPNRLTYLARWPSRKAMQHARDRIRFMTMRARLAAPVEEVVADINLFLRGWAGYFRYGNSAHTFDKIVCRE